MQNTVPSIMQVSSGEKPTVMPARENSTFARPTVSSTKPVMRVRRFLLELKYFSIQLRTRPRRAPSTREKTISSRGARKISSVFTLPSTMARAAPKETAKTTRPTASSRATTGSRISVTGPLALYCRTTMRVAAGAVAVAMAPRVMAAGMGSLSPSAK